MMIHRFKKDGVSAGRWLRGACSYLMDGFTIIKVLDSKAGFHGGSSVLGDSLVRHALALGWRHMRTHFDS